MKHHLIKILWVLLISCSFSLAQSQREMNEAAYKAFKKTDIELNAVYKKLLLAGDDHSDNKLRIAQRAWLKSVDKKINEEFNVPKGANPYDLYGSSYDMEVALLKTKLFKKRIKELKSK